MSRSTQIGHYAAQMTLEVAHALAAYVKQARNILSVPGAKPEVSLYSIFQKLVEEASAALNPGGKFQFVPQAGAADVGIPDYRATRDGELLGWLELKAPDKELSSLTGHDANQHERFRDGLRNVIFTNGWQWRLYQDGRLIAEATVGSKAGFDPTALVPAVSDEAIQGLSDLLRNFLLSSLTPYGTADGAVSALAVRARALRSGLLDIGEAQAGSMLLALRDDFKNLVFRNGQRYDWAQFVDSYVQIAAFGAFLWRLEARSDISLDLQVGLKHGVHPLLHQCLQILWNAQSRPPMLEPLLEALCQTINMIPFSLFEKEKDLDSMNVVADPIVHAYEPFFSVYDSNGREAAGVFYTPVQVVQQIVSGIEHFLVHAFDKPLGILDPTARFLDPATGTGTFLLGLAKAAERAAVERGFPVDQAVAELITERVSAFELLPGAYTIAHQRIETLLEAYGAPATSRLPIYLTDTLAAPEVGALVQSGFGFAGDEIMKERERADEVKAGEELLVVFGNPPYERLPASNAREPFARELMTILRNATPEENRVDLKSASDLFVAFWLWGMWVLQPPQVRMSGAQTPTLGAAKRHGIIAYISNRTWLVGRSLVGLRRLLGEGAKEIWILDLGGDLRGSDGVRDFAGGDQNVFDVQVGVAIAWVIYDRDFVGEPVVRYKRMFGARQSKLAHLVTSFNPNDFEEIGPERRRSIFADARWDNDILASSPTISQWFSDAPRTGFQSARDTKRYSPLNVDKSALLSVDVVKSPRAGALTTVRSGILAEWCSLPKEERRREWETAASKRTGKQVPSVESLTPSRVRRVLYRPLDYRWIYDDPEWIDWYREDLHRVFESETDVPTLISKPRGQGAGVAGIHSSVLPEQHSFKGSAGGKAIWHLWYPKSWPVDRFSKVEDKFIVDGKRTGLSGAVVDWLDALGRQGQFEEAYSYLLAFLSAEGYSARNWAALDIEEARVPFVEDAGLFDEGARIGGELRKAWELQTVVPTDLRWSGASGAGLPLGDVSWRDGSLYFKNGRVLQGVPHEAWVYAISNYKVLKNWFAARRHWRLSMAQASEALDVVSSLIDILRLSKEADRLLAAFPAG